MRDTYDLGDKLVIVTTDRQSAFDRLLAAIPFKGQVRFAAARCLFWKRSGCSALQGACMGLRLHMLED